MAVYAISYDLDGPNRNYDGVADAIKACGAWWHHLDSTWLVDTTLDCSQIRDKVGAALDSGDDLLVVKLSGAWATRGFSDKAIEWLRNHLS